MNLSSMIFRQPTKASKTIENDGFKSEADKIYDKFNENNALEKEYSDIISEENGKKYQYVNLVQEGGGILGIALLGYTYILEKAGIRFIKLAGTSAGAINASMIACMKEDSDVTKSERILKYLNELNMFGFVDGHFIIQKITKNLITNDNYAKELAFSFKWFVLLSMSLLFFGNVLQWFNIELNAHAGLTILTMVVFFYFVYRNTQQESFDNMDDMAKELSEQRKLTQKPINWSFLVILTAVFFITFLIAILTKFQGNNSIIICDISIIFILILAPILLKRYFDKDNLAIVSLTFLLLPVLVLGISSYIPNQFLANDDKKMFFYGGFVYLIFITLLNKNLDNKFFFYSTLLCTILMAFGVPAFFDMPDNSEYSFLSLSAVMLSTFLIIIIGGIATYLFTRFKAAEYGINPGDYFLQWLRKILSENNDNKPFMLADLERVWYENIKNIRHRDTNIDVSDLKVFGDGGEFADDDKMELQNLPVAFITSEITTSNKVELPKMWKLYWKDKSDVEVAEFVRASMSIPFFFKPYKKTSLPADRKEYWDRLLNYSNTIPKEVQFVDGGVLSNFPFNIFHKPNITKTRIPTFGVRLKSTTDSLNKITGLGSYIQILFNAARYNYDQDFLNKNRYYRFCIKEIDVHQYNWLNFFVTEKEKKELFIKGAEAACEFLQSFDWKAFKEGRDAVMAKK